MDDFDFPVKGCVVAIVAIVAIIIAVAVIGTNFTYRVDPGKVGLLVNYTQKESDGSPKITVIPQSTFIWYNSWNGQAMFEYPIALQTLTMVAKGNEGDQTGDDSVSFLTQQGIPLKIDMNVQWRVTSPAKLYFLMPGIPLDGSFNHDVGNKRVE